MRKVLVMFLIVAISGISAFAQQNQEERRQRMEQMNERIATDLKLDDKQKAEFKKVNEKYLKKMTDEMQNMQDMDREERRAKMQAMNDERNADMKKIMTDEQFKQYQEALQAQRRNFGGGRN